MQRKFLLFLCLGIFSSHCVSKDSTASTEQKDLGPKCTIKDSTQGARLEMTKQWLGRFLDRMCTEEGTKDGWILFDQGGLGGGGEYGQTMVLSGEHMAKVFHVAVSGKEFLDDKGRDLSEKKKKAFLEDVKPHKSDEMKFQENWPDGFDMFEREFVHVEKSGSTLTISQRVKWRFGREKCEKHCKVEQAFQAVLK